MCRGGWGITDQAGLNGPPLLFFLVTYFLATYSIFIPFLIANKNNCTRFLLTCFVLFSLDSSLIYHRNLMNSRLAQFKKRSTKAAKLNMSRTVPLLYFRFSYKSFLQDVSKLKSGYKRINFHKEDSLEKLQFLISMIFSTK